MGRGEARGRWSADPVIDWVLREGRRMRDPQAVLGAICDRVRAAGMPLDRVYAFITTLHPQYFGYVLTWQDGRTGIIPPELVGQEIALMKEVVAFLRILAIERRELAVDRIFVRGANQSL